MQNRSIVHLEFSITQLAITISISKVEHLLNVLVRHTDWQVPHDVVEVRLNKKGYIS